MTRMRPIHLVVLLALLGCNRHPGDLPGAQREDRRSLNQRQSTERREQTEAQARDRADALHQARENLPARASDVRDESADLVQANRALAESITLACSGVATPDECPIDNSNVVSSSDTPHGLVVHLKSDAGTATEVRRRIDCYRARVVLRGAQEEGKCILDLANPDIAFASEPSGDHVVVTFTSPDETGIGRLRASVHALLVEIAARRSGPLHN